MVADEVKCYAFRDASENCEELMEEHVKGIIELMRSRWEFHGLVKKVSKLLKVDEKLVEDFLYIAVLLHDFGKMLEEYQRECREKGHTIFWRHYEISARFAINVAYKVNVLSTDDIERRIKKLLNEGDIQECDEGDLFLLTVVIPVYFHNYAHLNEKKVFDVYPKTKVKLDQGCKITMSKLIGVIRELAKSDLAKKLLNVINEEAMHGEVELSVLPLNRDTLLSFKATPGKAIAEALIGLINICDGQIARKNRKGLT